MAPRAPIATPTVAAASAGASLIPSPTITVTARSRSARTAATLSAGVCSAYTSSSPSTVATSRAGSARSPVSMTSRFKPGRAQPAHRAGCVAAQRVPQQHRTGWLALDAHPGDRGRCPGVARLTAAARPPPRHRVAGQFADAHPAAADGGGDAAARLFDDVGRAATTAGRG